MKYALCSCDYICQIAYLVSLGPTVIRIVDIVKVEPHATVHPEYVMADVNLPGTVCVAIVRILFWISSRAKIIMN